MLTLDMNNQDTRNSESSNAPNMSGDRTRCQNSVILDEAEPMVLCESSVVWSSFIHLKYTAKKKKSPTGKGGNARKLALPLAWKVVVPPPPPKKRLAHSGSFLDN